MHQGFCHLVSRVGIILLFSLAFSRFNQTPVETATSPCLFSCSLVYLYQMKLIQNILMDGTIYGRCACSTPQCPQAHRSRGSLEPGAAPCTQRLSGARSGREAQASAKPGVVSPETASSGKAR